jgi:hypothetical protein
MAVDALLLATHADRLRFKPNERVSAANLLSALAIKVDANDRVFFRTRTMTDRVEASHLSRAPYR